MTRNPSNLKLIGETVTVSYIADSSFGHGRFRLTNPGTSSVKATVETTWLELGDFRRQPEQITVFDLRLNRMVNPKNFKVEAGITMTFLVGFPTVIYEPRFGDSTAVFLQIIANGCILQARSQIKFERRIPSNV
jgi:hypothetical protein